MRKTVDTNRDKQVFHRMDEFGRSLGISGLSTHFKNSLASNVDAVIEKVGQQGAETAVFVQAIKDGGPLRTDEVVLGLYTANFQDTSWNRQISLIFHGSADADFKLWSRPSGNASPSRPIIHYGRSATLKALESLAQGLKQNP
jgi:hypothetical protein